MQTGGAAASRSGLLVGVKVKEENDGSVMGQHNHTFYIEFKESRGTNEEIHCKEPQTVLEAIRSCEKYKELEWSDDKIMIQWGTEDKENTIATHFPCSLLKDDDILIVSQTKETVGVNVDQKADPIPTNDEYSVFYIDTTGGTNTKTKKLFKNSKVKQFKFLCVYGEKNTTVQEALERDGRFAKLDKFKLSDNNKPRTTIYCTRKIHNLNGRKFKIQLLQDRTSSGSAREQQTGDSTPGPSGDEAQTGDRGSTPGPSGDEAQTGVRSSTPGPSGDEAQTGDRGSTPGPSGDEAQTGVRSSTPGPSGDEAKRVDTIHLQALVQRSGFNPEEFALGEVQKQLVEQFPALKKQMENRFPGNSFQEALELKKENFGQIQQDFSEFRTYRKLTERGKSVCKVVVEGFCSATGFVLIDNVIMTNAHVFKKCRDGNRLKKGLTVYCLFNYEDPESDSNHQKFKVENSLICSNEDVAQKQGSSDSKRVDSHTLDYAILKVQRERQTCGPAEQLRVPPEVPPEASLKLPPGLLEYFAEMPEDGGACIIGHPGGGVKRIDVTCVIEPEKREQTVIDRIHTLNSFTSILHLVNKIDKQGIEKIMMGGSREKEVTTYNTFMYHGASGSPVFDAQGRVCGLHTAGFLFKNDDITKNVIDFAQSLEIIMKDLVKTLTKPKFVELLGRIREVSDRNPFLRDILASVSGGESNTALQPVSVKTESSE